MEYISGQVLLSRGDAARLGQLVNWCRAVFPTDSANQAILDFLKDWKTLADKAKLP